MNELALFAGAGGGLLASRLLGWTTVAAVEKDPFCRRVLAARQADGSLERFELHEDVRDYHAPVGRFDVVSGGFPCQPFSTASRGRRTATDLWPDMLRIVLEARSAWVFAENVARDPIARAADDLHTYGYNCAYTAISASNLGAPHDRVRWWIVAHADPRGQPHSPIYAKTRKLPPTCHSNWWQTYPGSVGVPYGVAGRLDRPRLQALGNGQVPIVAASAWRLLKNVLDTAEKAAYS